MNDSTAREITELVRRWSDGEAGAFDRLIELVYDDLRRIAHHHLELGARGGTLDTTGLVHEAYLKLARYEGGTWEGRAQFFAFCSKAMRRILIDYARRRQAARRGGDHVAVPLTDDVAVVDAEVTRMLGVEEALQQLERRDERMGRIVECRFFGGMTIEDTAEALGVSPATVKRGWSMAQAWLYRDLRAKLEEVP